MGQEEFEFDLLFQWHCYLFGFETELVKSVNIIKAGVFIRSLSSINNVAVKNTLNVLSESDNLSAFIAVLRPFLLVGGKDKIILF